MFLTEHIPLLSKVYFYPIVRIAKPAFVNQLDVYTINLASFLAAQQDNCTKSSHTHLNIWLKIIVIY